MGTTNSAGIYEYDGTDSNLGPTLWNRLGASITTLVTDGGLFFFEAASQAEQDDLVADLGAPIGIYRSDVADGLNLRYTIDGSNWFTTDLRESEWINLSLNSGYTSVSGFTVQYRRKGDTIEYRGRVKPSGSNFTSGNYTVAQLPTAYRPNRQELRAVPLGNTDTAGRAWVETNGLMNVSMSVGASYVDLSQLSYYLT